MLWIRVGGIGGIGVGGYRICWAVVGAAERSMPPKPALWFTLLAPAHLWRPQSGSDPSNPACASSVKKSWDRARLVAKGAGGKG